MNVDSRSAEDYIATNSDSWGVVFRGRTEVSTVQVGGVCLFARANPRVKIRSGSLRVMAFFCGA